MGNFWLVKFPIFLYQGWIIVALVANVSTFLTSVGFEMAFSESVWAVVLLLIAGVVYIYETFKLRQVISVLVGIWGLVAVGYKQISISEMVGVTAFVVSGVMFLIVIFSVFKKSLHF